MFPCSKLPSAVVSPYITIVAFREIEVESKQGKSFSFGTRIRHALVESGVKIVGEAAWMNCRQLQIVHLPDTVVSLLHGARMGSAACASRQQLQTVDLS